MKSCTKCERELPLESFYKHKGYKDGLRSECKECARDRSRQYIEENPEKHKDRSKRYREENPDYHKQYCEENPEKVKEYCKRHYAKHIEMERERRKRYREENLEKVKESKNRYYEKNKEKYKERAKQYYQTERGKMVARARSHRRRALKRAVGGSHTAQDLADQMKRQKNKCFYCKEKIKKHDKWHADHVIPLVKGGCNTIDNIVIACPTCNMRKNASLWTLF